MTSYFNVESVKHLMRVSALSVVLAFASLGVSV